MKPMIWHPEPKDKKVNEYIDKTNRAPYFGIILGALGVFFSIYCRSIARCILDRIECGSVSYKRRRSLLVVHTVHLRRRGHYVREFSVGVSLGSRPS